MDTDTPVVCGSAPEPAPDVTPPPARPKICPICNLQMLPRGVCGECD